MSVEERIEQLEARCRQLQKKLTFQGVAIMIVGICTLILSITG